MVNGEAVASNEGLMWWRIRSGPWMVGGRDVTLSRVPAGDDSDRGGRHA